MKTPVIVVIQHLIFSLKSGSSITNALETFQKNHPDSWHRLQISSKPNLNQISISSVEYELQFIIERGQKGLPILNSLIDLNIRALSKLNTSIDQHTAKTPFLALIPLFTFQMPSLVIIFIYPLIKEMLQGFK